MLNSNRATSWSAAALALSASASIAQELAPVPVGAATPPSTSDANNAALQSVPQVRPISRGGWGGAYGRAVVGDGASALVGSACQPCLPYRTPWPCGVGLTDRCVNLPYSGFLFYGTDPRDDDPLNHTWTTCVGDEGNHAARKQVRHVRRFGY